MRESVPSHDWERHAPHCRSNSPPRRDRLGGGRRVHRAGRRLHDGERHRQGRRRCPGHVLPVLRIQGRCGAGRRRALRRRAGRAHRRGRRGTGQLRRRQAPGAGRHPERVHDLRRRVRADRHHAPARQPRRSTTVSPSTSCPGSWRSSRASSLRASPRASSRSPMWRPPPGSFSAGCAAPSSLECRSRACRPPSPKRPHFALRALGHAEPLPPAATP